MARQRRPGGGRKPKPTAAKKREGTFRKDRAAKNEPKIPRAIPEPPDFLTRRELDDWDALAELLYNAGTLTAADEYALAQLVFARSRWRTARHALWVHGAVEATKSGGTKRSGYSIEYDAAQKSLAVLESRFGLDPSSRTRLDAIPVPTGGVAAGGSASWLQQHGYA